MTTKEQIAALRKEARELQEKLKEAKLQKELQNAKNSVAWLKKAIDEVKG